MLGAYKTFGVGVVGDMDPTATGEMGAIFRLAPSLQLIRSPENKHTDADVPEIVPAVGPRSGRARVREDRRRGEQARSQGAAAGDADDDRGVGPVTGTTKDHEDE